MSLFVDTSAGVDQGSVTTDLFSISWNDGNLGQGADTTVTGGLNGITSIPVAPVTYSSVTTGKDTANRLFTLVNNTAADGLNWSNPIVITALPGGIDPYFGNSIDGNGQTYLDTTVTPNIIHVVYDTSQDGGAGIALFDTGGNAIQSPNCVILYHELSHAFHAALNQIPFPQTDCPGNTSDEPAAEKDENVMRTELGLCLRDVCNHGGEAGWGKACGGSAFPGGPPLVDGNAPPDNGGGCFVVTAAAGTPYALEIWRLRAMRDELAKRSQLAGRLIAAIYEEYAGFGPTLAEAIAFDKGAQAKVRTIVVRPLFAWYELAHVLASGPAAAERVAPAREALLKSCQPALAPWIALMLERALRGASLPGIVRPSSETATLIRAAAARPLASWALLDALANAWRCAAGRADPVAAVSEWLAAAPLDRLAEPTAEWMDVELSQLARLLDFAPEARLAQGRRLEAAWPRASAALRLHGLVGGDVERQ